MIKDRLISIRQQLPPGVALVAVSKFHPVERVQEAYAAGQRIFAESRPQELSAKVPQLPADVQWHFIGHLQTNKLKLVLPHVSLVQSVDSLHLLEAISDWAVANNRIIDVLLELHLGAEETKQGFTESEILSIVSGAGALSRNCSHPRLHKREGPADEVGGRGREATFLESAPAPETEYGIRIRGLMGMATNTDDEAVIEADFARIERLFKKIQALGIEGFDQLSIGMSSDWPIAVRHSATMVRIGTDIFGPRGT